MPFLPATYRPALRKLRSDAPDEELAVEILQLALLRKGFFLPLGGVPGSRAALALGKSYGREEEGESGETTKCLPPYSGS